MKPVAEIHRITESLIFWQGYNPAVRCDCGSCAILTQSGWIIFDPIALTDTAWDEAFAGTSPIHAIALTNGNHQRDSLALREKFNLLIHAPAAAKGEIEADVWLKEDDDMAGLKLIDLSGAAPGEAAYCNGETLVLGDALIHLQQLDVLPDKYCVNPKLLRSSLKKLLPLKFQGVFFAHGIPLVSNAQEAIESMIRS